MGEYYQLDEHGFIGVNCNHIMHLDYKRKLDVHDANK